MKLIIKVCFFYILLLTQSCVRVDDGGFRYTVVVEGWIEEGGAPYVILMQTMPLFSVIDSMAIEDVLIKWAKVSVSDGETTEILTGRMDTTYFPPFLYRATNMRGETGKTYKLKIEYSGRVWEAETTIPATVPLESITSKTMPENDTLKFLEAVFYDPVGEKNYYRFQTRLWNKGKRYVGSLMGNLDDNLFEGKYMKTSVYQGLDVSQSRNQEIKFNPYFHINDTVQVKFSTTTEFGFRYWTTYENELINSQNMFFPANKNLRSNILPDGKGIWCGYGQETYIIIPK